MDRVKAKIDTGARTSALHAFELDTVNRRDGLWVTFAVHPNQRDEESVVRSQAKVTDRRIVRDSGGHEEERFVITTDVEMGGERWPIELTLTARDNMGFRMLLGRTAMRGRYMVDPARSYTTGRRM
ncbi:MAG TPA: RimK/LysX family protein [Pseudomonadales bacterium]